MPLLSLLKYYNELLSNCFYNNIIMSSNQIIYYNMYRIVALLSAVLELVQK